MPPIKVVEYVRQDKYLVTIPCTTVCSTFRMIVWEFMVKITMANAGAAIKAA